MAINRALRFDRGRRVELEGLVTCCLSFSLSISLSLSLRMGINSALRFDRRPAPDALGLCRRLLRPADLCSQFKKNYFTEMCSGSEAGSFLRLIDFCITQL